MTIMKSPYIHALFVSGFTLFYAALFYVTANHMELNSMLATGTLNSSFWNGLTQFIGTGNMKYVSYLMLLLLGVFIVAILLKRQKRYDEYQASILTKLMIVAGVVSMIMLPLMLFILLTDRNYLVETLFLFITVQWLSVLIGNVFYTLKY